MAWSCWRSRNSRCCFSMPSPTSWRIFSATSCSASSVARQLERALDPALGVDRLEQLDLALGRHVRPRAEAVGQRARLGRRAQQLGQPPATGAARRAPTARPQLAAELLGPGGRPGDRLDLVGLDPQRGTGPGDAGAERGAVQAAEDRGVDAVGQLARLLDGGDGADAGVAPVDAGDEQDDGRLRRRPRRRRPRASSESRVSVPTVLGSTTPVAAGAPAALGCPSARARGSPIVITGLTRLGGNPGSRQGPLPHSGDPSRTAGIGRRRARARGRSRRAAGARPRWPRRAPGPRGSTVGLNRPTTSPSGGHEELLEVPADVAGVAVGDVGDRLELGVERVLVARR